MQRASQRMTVSIPVGRDAIQGDLTIPEHSNSLVIFAHGSGSSRHSRRNKYVAETLNDGRMTTLLIDLLTSEEEAVDAYTARLRFDIPLLADRLIAATDWAARQNSFSGMRVGYFGASTGAAAALVAAARRPEAVEAIVSRGGRPDLAGDALGKVKAPTLLIVGEFDHAVVAWNREAAKAMTAPTKIQIVPRATHLFEETGALEQAAAWARAWFEEKLAGTAAA